MIRRLYLALAILNGGISVTMAEYMKHHILSLDMPWWLFIGPLLCKIGIELLFLTGKLFPQLGSCVLKSSKVCLRSRNASRYLSG